MSSRKQYQTLYKKAPISCQVQDIDSKDKEYSLFAGSLEDKNLVVLQASKRGTQVPKKWGLWKPLKNKGQYQYIEVQRQKQNKTKQAQCLQ